VRPGSPGFGSVIVEPRLGTLSWIEGSVPHPAGTVTTRFHRGAKRMEAAITLPPGVRGELRWLGAARKLSPGANHLRLPVTAP
jgi:hypothetical protein